MSIHQTVVFVLILSFINISAQTKVDINNYGHKIQLDGFLMEWNLKAAKKWDKNQHFFWDAVNTSEGLAGFIKSAGKLTCKNWNFTVDPEKAAPFNIRIPSESLETNFYAIDRQAFDSTGMISLEWLIPWDSIAFDSSGEYAVSLSGTSGCGDTLDPLFLTGKQGKAPGIISAALLFRVGLFVILLLILIVLRIRIRNRTARKG